MDNLKFALKIVHSQDLPILQVTEDLYLKTSAVICYESLFQSVLSACAIWRAEHVAMARFRVFADSITREQVRKDFYTGAENGGTNEHGFKDAVLSREDTEDK